MNFNWKHARLIQWKWYTMLGKTRRNKYDVMKQNEQIIKIINFIKLFWYIYVYKNTVNGEIKKEVIKYCEEME